MALVQSVDYVNKRIYLSVSTMNTEIDTIDIYKEVRALRRTTEAHRNFLPMIIAGGNIEKIPNVSATPAFAQLLYGCKIVPYNSSHSLKLVRDTFTDTGLAGRDCFDRSGLSAGVVVDIDVDFPAIEIRKILASGNSGLTDEDIDAIWNSMKADSGIPGSYGEHLKALQNSSGSNVISVTAGSIARLIGSNQGGNLATIQAHDDSYYSTGEAVGQGLSVSIGVTVNPSYLPNACRLTGHYAGGAGHTVNIMVYNFLLDMYEQKGIMLNRSTPFDYVIPLTVDNISSGVVDIMLEHSTGTYIASHRLHVDYVQFDFTDTVNAILSDIAAIKNKTDQLAFTLGRLNVNSQMISDSIAAADSVETNIQNLNADLTEISNVLNQVKTLTMAGL
jgi:hypothetical protein